MTESKLTDRIANLSQENRAKLFRQLHGAKPHVAASMATHGNPSAWPSAHVRLHRPGNIDSLHFEPMPLIPPGPGLIQIRAHAVSLNFRDLMIALGMYPPSPGVPTVMGSDYAGVVVACGEGVEGYAPGDRVMALSAGDVGVDGTVLDGSHFCTMPKISAFQVVRMPANLSFVEAASIPTAFLTAYYGLHHIARVEQGERVLIHSATGGVGLAALEVARWRGGEVVATAGSQAKRSYLAELGVTHVYDSRSLAFADRIEGGVDVVLNTLAGEAANRGLGLLRPFGRFLQIDKHDIAQDGSLPLTAFRNGLTFAVIDLSLFLLKPKTMTQLFAELADHFASGRLRPTPIRSFPPEQLGDALRLMSQFRHIGKIVIDFEIKA